jgi:Tfp pilus assembly protein PilF
MSRPRRTTSVSWVMPGIIFALVCAGLPLLLLKRHTGNRQAPTTIVREGESQELLPQPDANDRLLNLAVTNQPEAQDHEDRVVALVAEGIQLFEKGNYAEAAQKYEQAVAISPDQEDLHYNLAIALAKMGKTEDAKKQYEEALRIFPDYAEAHNNLGNLLMNENSLEQAIERFREAIKNMPENASFHNNLGTAFGRQGKVVEAMVEFEEAVKRAPAYVEARVNLANAFLASGRVDEAIGQLNEALRLKPDFKPALQTMQRARQRQDSSRIQK